MSAALKTKDTASRPVASAAEGIALIKHLGDVMDALLGAVEEETSLVRAGKLADAAKLEATKTELSSMYIADAARIKAAVVAQGGGEDVAAVPQALAAARQWVEEHA